MSTDVVIAPAREQDAIGFHAALDSVARERTWLARDEAPPLDRTIEFMRKLIENGNIQLLATHHGTVIGWCDIHPRREAADTGAVGIGIIKQWRGKGIGERLLRETLLRAQGQFTRIELEVRTDNSAAIALYKKLGFSIESNLSRDISETPVDLHLMLWQGFPA